MTIAEVKARYAAARCRAGMPLLSDKRMTEIACAKIALDKWLAEGSPRQSRYGRNAKTDWLAMPTPPKPPAALPLPADPIDIIEARLWSPGCSAFWLDPERWLNLPMGANGHMEPFWMHLA